MPNDGFETQYKKQFERLFLKLEFPNWTIIFLQAQLSFLQIIRQFQSRARIVNLKFKIVSNKLYALFLVSADQPSGAISTGSGSYIYGAQMLPSPTNNGLILYINQAVFLIKFFLSSSQIMLYFHFNGTYLLRI